MKVEAVTEVLDGHGRALQVPAGPSRSPRRLPGRLAGPGRFPQREVACIPLARAARIVGRAHLVQLLAGQLAVTGIGTDVEVHVAVSRVGVPALDQPPDHRDHLGHVASGPRLDVRRQAAERVVRIAERPHVPLGHGPPRHILPLGHLQDLVVDIGDVAAERDLLAAGPQPPHQDVEVDPGPEMADMRRRLDRGATQVQGHRARNERTELANRPGGGVVQALAHPAQATGCARLPGARRSSRGLNQSIRRSTGASGGHLRTDSGGPAYDHLPCYRSTAHPRRAARKPTFPR